MSNFSFVHIDVYTAQLILILIWDQPKVSRTPQKDKQELTPTQKNFPLSISGPPTPQG